jgi:hypothetical protein
MRTATFLIAALLIFAASDALARPTACTRPCYITYNSCPHREIKSHGPGTYQGDICLIRLNACIRKCEGRS